MSEWQDISTAPKDGTIIDVWVNDPDGPFRQTGVIWNDGYWVLRRNMWSSVESFFDEKGTPKIKITHWMPLPAPPITDPDSTLTPRGLSGAGIAIPPRRSQQPYTRQRPFADQSNGDGAQRLKTLIGLHRIFQT